MADAKRFQANNRARVQKGEWIDPALAKHSFSEAVDQWEEVHEVAQLHAEDAGALRERPCQARPPGARPRPIARIDYPTLSDFLAVLADSGVSASTVHKVWEAVRAPLGGGDPG